MVFVRPLVVGASTMAIRNQRYSLTVGTEAMSETLDPSWKPPQLVVSVGAPFAQGVSSTRPWRVRLDDVSVITEP